MLKKTTNERRQKLMSMKDEIDLGTHYAYVKLMLLIIPVLYFT